MGSVTETYKGVKIKATPRDVKYGNRWEAIVMGQGVVTRRKTWISALQACRDYLDDKEITSVT